MIFSFLGSERKHLSRHRLHVYFTLVSVRNIATEKLILSKISNNNNNNNNDNNNNNNNNNNNDEHLQKNLFRVF